MLLHQAMRQELSPELNYLSDLESCGLRGTPPTHAGCHITQAVQVIRNQIGSQKSDATKQDGVVFEVACYICLRLGGSCAICDGAPR
jgi:hypothetical protein